jgi:hypothetical protein
VVHTTVFVRDWLGVAAGVACAMDTQPVFALRKSPPRTAAVALDSRNGRLGTDAPLLVFAPSGRHRMAAEAPPVPSRQTPFDPNATVRVIS